MKKIILVLLILTFFGYLVSAETTYGENWELITHNDNSKLLKIGVANVQDENNNWKPLTQVAKINYHDYLIRFSFNQYWVDYQPYVIYNNQKYTLEWIVNHFNNVKDHIAIDDNRNFWKWKLTISGIPTNLKNNTQYVGFDYFDSNNLSWNDLTLDKNRFLITIKNTIDLSYFDLIHHNYSVDANKETILIGNLDANYPWHDLILNHWQQDVNGLWNITFDPVITKTTKTVSLGTDDACDENQNSDSTYIYDDDNASYLIAKASGQYKNNICGLRFQNIPIEQGATITDANLGLYTWAICSNRGGCATNFYGIASDDTSTWSSGNRPKDAVKTTNFCTLSTTSVDISNGTYIYRKVNASNTIPTKYLKGAIQEIVNRAGWASGNAMSFVSNQSATTGTGNTLTMFTYEISLYNVLEIAYTTGDTCTPPTSGDWVVNDACYYSTNVVAPANIYIGSTGVIGLTNATLYFGVNSFISCALGTNPFWKCIKLMGTSKLRGSKT